MATGSKGMDSLDPYDQTNGELDPRIKNELECLNQAASDVNRLEKEINEARNKYQETFYECSQALEHLRKKYGAKINKARPYYEVKEHSKGAQLEAMLSARKFQSANGVYLAAKETISLAELRLKDDKAACLSPAWQEMLNHALIRVMESEHEKTRSEKEHLQRAAVFADMEKKLHILEKKHKRSIAKAKPYFDSKNELELRLQQIKLTVEDLQQAISAAKSQYSKSLENLEAISDGIHEARRQELILMYPREPGVGAEEASDPLHKELPTLPSSSTDLDLASHSVQDGKCDYDEDDDKSIDSTDSEAKSSDQIIIKEATSNQERRPVRIVGVKDKQQTLRKSLSLPSYVTENPSYVTEDPSYVIGDPSYVIGDPSYVIGDPSYVIGNPSYTNTQTLTIETDTMLVKIDSGCTDSESVLNNCISKTCQSKTKQIDENFNPSAFPSRHDAIGDSDGDT